MIPKTPPLDARFHGIQAEAIVEVNELAQHQAEVYTEIALAMHYAQLETVNQRIEQGIVVCRGCENPIPLARLNAQPRCTRCIECQTHYEKG